MKRRLLENGRLWYNSHMSESIPAVHVIFGMLFNLILKASAIDSCGFFSSGDLSEVYQYNIRKLLE